jgi:hypothetical protein
MHRQRSDLISLLLFFKIRKTGEKTVILDQQEARLSDTCSSVSELTHEQTHSHYAFILRTLCKKREMLIFKNSYYLPSLLPVV